jgi:hypothetical protein
MELQAYQGGEIKALGDGRVGGYLVRFTSPSEPDLTGQFFTKDTSFGTNFRPPVIYHHGLDGTVKTAIMGESTLKMDDIGLWIEAQLNMADRYIRAVYDHMVTTGKAGWSSGAGTVEFEAVGDVEWI